MKSCNCNCNDEHYVVRPNIHVYDWDYDYDVNGTSGGTGTVDVINLTELAQNVLDEMERHPEQYNFANIGSNDLTEL